MLTFEDVTALFLKAASRNAFVTHPEYWLNSRSLEREFACACHTGTCEETETHSSCTLSFTWGTLDTALSLEGPAGICDFFHEADQDCPHLHTNAVPPLVLDLSYSLPLNGTNIPEDSLLTLTQALKLHASEHSKRTVETRPGVTMVLHEGTLRPDMLTLQQRVELPIWHPDGLRGLHEDSTIYAVQERYTYAERGNEDEQEIVASLPRPEEWLPQVMEDICQDILQVLAALDATISHNLADNA